MIGWLSNGKVVFYLLRDHKMLRFSHIKVKCSGLVSKRHRTDE